MFKNAIVLKPCPEMVQGITTANLSQPDSLLALLQHEQYVAALRECGLTVDVLDADNSYPDSTFIEDVALCTRQFAVITRPGAASRRGEIEGMKVVLHPYYDHIREIKAPGTLEAGDVMMVGDYFYIGISDRTNQEGADQLIRLLQQFGMDGSTIHLKEFLHLKSGLSYLEHNNLLISGEFVVHPAFEQFNKIVIPEAEALAANSVWVNETVLIPAGNPETQKMITAAGYRTLALEISEFQKLDGGLSCLSLRF